MNRIKGDQKIKLLGGEYTLRPTHEALANAEEISGTGIIDLITKFRWRKQKAADVFAVLFSCMHCGHEANDKLRTYSFEEFSNEAFKLGVLQLFPTAFLLLNVLVGGDAAAEEQELNAAKEEAAEKNEIADGMSPPVPTPESFGGNASE